MQFGMYQNFQLNKNQPIRKLKKKLPNKLKKNVQQQKKKRKEKLEKKQKKKVINNGYLKINKIIQMSLEKNLMSMKIRLLNLIQKEIN